MGSLGSQFKMSDKLMANSDKGKENMQAHPRNRLT